ncbi:ribosomal protein S5 domain 2-type protein [Lentinula detonsa]|uniref:Ribosomal protein S5 domain 2-type protein n=1 Tax=Lentinula detonsa TaxID=2804962 RepID=A0A9W8P7Q0_9AGAR|nr:ribosomal protein S5 domain 2-type protein [Lentinula detonsa]KAJ3986613.1 ribosomal protein S5 domain 2-type protein [Lentinula detonsa]
MTSSAESSKVIASNLDSFVRRSQPLPEPKSTSQEIRDRSSTFVANIFPAATPEEAKSHVHYLRKVLHASRPATHEISAYRCMVLKAGKTGLAGPEDFELKTGCDDDGEQWAGIKVLKVMESLAVLDAVVICSRWYGGIMLGSVRFTHIETCVAEVCRTFKSKQELEDCIAMLSTLDDILKQLRAELAVLSGPSASTSSTDDSPGPKLRPPDYTSWTESDIPKARRLVTAREKAVASVKSMIAKRSATAT